MGRNFYILDSCEAENRKNMLAPMTTLQMPLKECNDTQMKKVLILPAGSRRLYAFDIWMLYWKKEKDFYQDDMVGVEYFSYKK